jgi:LPS-assembly protein
LQGTASDAIGSNVACVEAAGPFKTVKKLSFICRTALPLLLCVPGAALAQEAQDPLAAAISGSDAPVEFSSDQLTYDTQNEVVTVSGNVRMAREGNNLRADRVIWDRRSGEVRAEGNVRIVNPGGDAAYGDSIVLTDTFRDGVVQNLLVVLEDGGRLVAAQGERRDGYTTLNRAAYTPCAVTDEHGCPKDPSWKITAVRVTHDPVRNRIRYEGARFSIFGLPLIALPGLSHPDGSEGGGNGLLVPSVRLSRRNGFEVALPYYFKLAPNRDLTVTPHIFTGTLPMLEAQYRQLTELGAFQVTGYLTHSTRSQITQTGLVEEEREGFRGYLEANGRFQLDPLWSITAAGRYVSDRTFLSRYDISRDDRLRSLIEAERISENSYISIAGWAFQGLRLSDIGRPQPFALPAIDARWRFDNFLWNGRLELQANSLSILRSEGQDSQRVFASARWDRHSITALGQELILTAFARGDVYHADDTRLTPVPLYRGTEGWSARGIAALAAEMRWPFIGRFMNGTQRLTPRVQVVASPPTKNLSIPNEDARAIELEDTNLFALNRFPGYDRWEDGMRLTYGVDWAVDLPRTSLRTTIGQSYRLDRKPIILPEGTGLSTRFSDIVGRTTLRFSRTISLVHRFRLDKDNLAVRRNEIDAVVGGRQTYATLGYFRLDRDNPLNLEDLRDREEIRVGGRVRFARYWSIFGSTVIDLTSSREDPFTDADGFQPVRDRLGIAYDDDCVEIGVTWRRDYDQSDAFRRGNSFLFRIALKNLGR